MTALNTAQLRVPPAQAESQALDDRKKLRKDAIKMPLSFSPERLLEDLNRAEARIRWHDHPDYTVAKAGDWTAVALIAPASVDANDPKSLRYIRGAQSQPTELLEQCPYLQEVIGAFRTDIHRARLMNLKPGTNISAHRDYGQQRYSIERGFMRVHIPIRTHERVSFFIHGVIVPMRAGEAWYTNVCQPHAVKNESDVHRVHLVLDMAVNDWVLSQLPPLTLLDRARGVILRRYERRFLALRKSLAAQYKAAKERLGDAGLRRIRDAIRR